LHKEAHAQNSASNIEGLHPARCKVTPVCDGKLTLTVSWPLVSTSLLLEIFQSVRLTSLVWYSALCHDFFFFFFFGLFSALTSAEGNSVEICALKKKKKKKNVLSSCFIFSLLFNGELYNQKPIS
jgi:hypothetical protein